MTAPRADSPKVAYNGYGLHRRRKGASAMKLLGLIVFGLMPLAGIGLRMKFC